MRLSIKQSVVAVLYLCALSLTANPAYAGWLPSISDADSARLQLAAKNHLKTNQRSNGKPLHELDVEVLLIETRETKKQTKQSTLAEIFVFDYNANEASMQLLDITSGKVMSSQVINGQKLPLNANESQYALKLLSKNTEFIARLNNEMQRQFGISLQSLNDVDMKISVWSPNPHQLNKSQCEFTRCALVSIFTKNHFNFSVEPVIDLVNNAIYLDLVQ